MRHAWDKKTKKYNGKLGDDPSSTIKALSLPVTLQVLDNTLLVICLPLCLKLVPAVIKQLQN